MIKTIYNVMCVTLSASWGPRGGGRRGGGGGVVAGGGRVAGGAGAARPPAAAPVPGGAGRPPARYATVVYVNQLWPPWSWAFSTFAFGSLEKKIIKIKKNFESNLCSYLYS